MKKQIVLIVCISCLVTVLFLNACGGGATIPPTVVPTSVPPTPTQEQYEPITTADFQPNMQLSGEIRWDANGLVSGGPVDSFSFWGQDIELTSNMITDGFLSTKDYGKILIKANGNGSMHIELTPSQQIKIKQLKK